MSTDLRIVSHTSARHEVSCAVFDPVAGRCDCNVQDGQALVLKSQADAEVARLQAQIAEAQKRIDNYSVTATPAAHTAPTLEQALKGN